MLTDREEQWVKNQVMAERRVMDFDSIEYIKKRIAAGNDLSPKHGQILLDRVEDLTAALEMIRDDETDYPGKVAADALKGIE